MRSFIRSTWVIVGLLLAPPTLLVAADTPVVPVRVLPARTQEPSQTLNQDSPTATPETALGLFPQYQSTAVSAARSPDEESGKVRMLLRLAPQLLLIDVEVTVDGRPFNRLREEKIDRLLAELQKGSRALLNSESATPEPARQGSPNSDETQEVETSSESQDALPPVPVPTLEARLQRYASVTGRVPSREELHWLLAKWSGPTFLLLEENFQRFRASQAPLWDVLDRDRDGQISPAELTASPHTLRACDVNQDDLVEYSELARFAGASSNKRAGEPRPMMIPIRDADSVAESFHRFAQRSATVSGLERFDMDSNGELDADEYSELRRSSPHLVVAVAFDSREPARSTITLKHLAPELSVDANGIRTSGTSIMVPAAGRVLELSAVQAGDGSGADQLSLGVVEDGYPLLPVVDSNADGRLTIRELRKVVALLKSFDTDRDGGLSPGEVPSTVRLSIGLGTVVHVHLADIRSVQSAPLTEDVGAPEWFTRMDVNKDGDISRREFLLGAEQFQKLDADGDGLIDPAEAVKSTRDER